MSLIKVEITEDHIKLVRQLIITKVDNVLFATDEDGSPFGGDNLYEDIDLILVGAPEGGVKPFSEPEPLTDEVIARYQALYEDLPNVLEVVLSLATFETGHYKRKYSIRRGGWAKYTPKLSKTV
jgi:hypothetical protein